MGNFKYGDWARVVDADGGGKVGDVAKVIGVERNGYYRLSGLSGFADGLYGHRLEPWKPKVGDRVRVVYGHGWDGDGVVERIHSLQNIIVEMKTGGHQGSSGGFALSFLQPLPVAEQPAALVIEAGKFYKTRDGRKVGPMERNGGRTGQWYWEAPRLDGEYSPYWCKDGKFYEKGDDFKHDLIAEWVDEPAVAATASNDNGPLAALIGKTFTAQVKTRVNPAIVALIENGQPKPAPQPYVHASEAAAAKEAARLAGIHKGQQFGVYVLTTTSQEAAPTYKHGWQRLAAKGEKIAAIKELRSITGLGLKASKDAVEHWIANDEPYSRIAA